MKQKLSLFLLHYFRTLAKLQLRKYAPDIIGITGSSGKTTTKNAVAALISSKYKTKVSEKANSESGIPLNILDLSPHDYSLSDWLRLTIEAPLQLLSNWKPYDKYIVEMGIDSAHPPKNMKYLLTILQPRTGIFLNASTTHSYGFDDLVKENDPTKRLQKIVQAIAQEKGELIRALPENGLAILNADDPNVVKFASQTKAKVMTFGRSSSNTVQITTIERDGHRTRFVFTTSIGLLDLSLPYILADHYAYSLAAAICVGIDEAISLDKIKHTLETKFYIEPGRFSVFEGINGSTLIDSSYNSSPEPTIGALTMLHSLPGKRKLALLGDMRELGEETAEAHRQVIDTAIQNVDELILVGPLMHHYALPYLAQKQFQPVAWFDSPLKAAQYLKGSLKKDDYLLIKGSQNTIFLEIAVAALLKNQQDVTKLCRRGEYWDKLRHQYTI